MILDYAYNRNKRVLSISYIKKDGMKSLLSFNVNRFKSYYKTPTGKFINWDGSKCDIRYVSKPSIYDIMTFIKELPEKYQVLLKGKTPPKLFTFDIETEISDEFPEPSKAEMPITTISVVDSNFNCIVLGTKDLGDNGDDYIQENFSEWFKKSDFFKHTHLPLPKIKYVPFQNEEQMLKYFLHTIVAKVPIIAGWNSIMFDWQYIQNRIRGYYPDLSFASSSINWSMHNKNYRDFKNDAVKISIPNHTIIVDMMDVVGTFDYVVMPIKESLSLDYIASNSVGEHKIKYKGDLQKLFNEEYPKYVFYNAIDSVLVAFIDKKFKTLQNMYTQALYCGTKIPNTFSKIALSESLIFNDFYEHGIKVIAEEHSHERGKLLGAYVKKPIPGLHNFVCCNDFSSLYPSTIRTTNISYDNFLGHNFTTSEIEKYKNNENYFVSTEGNVYNNDKEYSFKRIQRTLKENRDKGKYLAKQIDAQVMYDVEHILKNKKISNRQYGENISNVISNIGYDVKETNDLYNIKDLIELKRALGEEITFYVSYEQSMKLLMNSMYGGVSHVANSFYNIELANDITSESRNLTHMMEHHIPDFWRNNWLKMTDLHKILGITVNKKQAEEVLENAPVQTNDEDAYQKPSYVTCVYGDTDSLYLCYDGLLNTIDGIENMSLTDKMNIIIKINLEFMDNHNKVFIEDYYKTRHGESVHNFELETINKSGVWLDIKKRYAQLLLWKDGKIFDGELPLKVKGLEIVKGSYPAEARRELKEMVTYLLNNGHEQYLLQKLNIKMMELKKDFYKAKIFDICGTVGVNNYAKYVLDDINEVKLGLHCPFNVRAAANHNYIINSHNIKDEQIHSGKIKYYLYRPKNGKLGNVEYMSFVDDYPEWANKFAPIDKDLMFKKLVLDPFNRILVRGIGLQELTINGELQLSLF